MLHHVMVEHCGHICHIKRMALVDDVIVPLKPLQIPETLKSALRGGFAVDFRNINNINYPCLLTMICGRRIQELGSNDMQNFCKPGEPLKNREDFHILYIIYKEKPPG